MELLADAQRDYRVDPDRLYLTGLSGGANLSLELGVSNTAKLAAIVPIATTANDPNVCNMKHLPIRAFHVGHRLRHPGPLRQAPAAAHQRAAVAPPPWTAAA